MGVIRIEGLEELQKQLKKNADMQKVKSLVRKHGGQLQNNMTRKADFKEGYQTGTTKRSISETGVIFKDDGLTAEVGPTTDYAEYLEFGTRFMDAQPFVKPALEEQSKKFESDLRKLIE